MIERTKNAHMVATNPYMGNYPRILTLCSAGVLRGPTIAEVLAEEFPNANIRCAGVDTEFALVPLSTALWGWADIVIFAEDDNRWTVAQELKTRFGKEFPFKDHIIYTLNIPDNYPYKDRVLVEIIEKALESSGASEGIHNNFLQRDISPV